MKGMDPSPQKTGRRADNLLAPSVFLKNFPEYLTTEWIVKAGRAILAKVCHTRVSKHVYLIASELLSLTE